MGSELQIKRVDPKRLKIKKPFKGLFPKIPATIERMRQSLIEHGFDQSKPVVCWKKGKDLLVVDGITRTELSIEMRSRSIPVYPYDFEDEAEALDYAIKSQLDRRNLSEPEIMRCIAVVDPALRKRYGGKREKGESGGESAKQTGKSVGVGATTVKNVRAINEPGNEDLKKKVDSGELSIKAAAVIARQRKKKAGRAEKPRNKPKLERAGKDYPFAGWLWNAQFKSHLQVPKEGKVKVDKKTPLKDKLVLLCPDMDLMTLDTTKDGKEQIQAVFETILQCPGIWFLMITEKPGKLKSYKTLPDNLIIGVSVSTQGDVDKLPDVLKEKPLKGGAAALIINPFKKFLNLQPLLKDELIQWVILGADQEQPPSWDDLLKFFRDADTFKRPAVFFLPSLVVSPQEFPEG